MRISIFGATGQVGRQLVRLALYQGHQVKAYGRNIYNAGFQDDDNLELCQGGLFDEDLVKDAVEGSDAVLSVIGGSFDGTDKARSLGMKYIISAMQKNKVKRIIALGGKGQLDGPEGQMLMDDPEFPEIFLPVSREHLKALQRLTDSGLDWTFICSPNIIDGDPTGHFLTSAHTVPTPDKNQVFSGDLALCMLQELQKNEYIHQRVGISN